MEYVIRNAAKEDYEAIRDLYHQVQEMHVEWRPDIYKHNDCLMALNCK